METRSDRVGLPRLARFAQNAAVRIHGIVNTAHLRASRFITNRTQVQNPQTLVVALILVSLGAAARLLPHEANFAPIAAMALFGAVYLKPKYALLIPFAALFISDMFLGFDSLNSRLSVYGAFLLVGLIGLAVRRHKSVLTVIGGSLAGSVVFFLVTNFVFFYPPVMYTHDLAGQLSSYYNALPFFRGTLLGDLFYTGVFFGTYALATYLARRKAHVVAQQKTRLIKRGESGGSLN